MGFAEMISLFLLAKINRKTFFSVSQVPSFRKQHCPCQETLKTHCQISGGKNGRSILIPPETRTL